MRLAIAVLVIGLASLTVLGQGAPTLSIRTEVPGLPSELYYGNVKIKPLRLRPGTNTPITINDSDFFVHQQYVDFFSRFPDQSGFDFWVNQIAVCGTNAACIDGARDNTSGAFFLSIEFQQTGFLVYNFYKAAFGNIPSAPVPVKYEELMPDTRIIGQGVIVNQGNWQALLEANKQAFATAFVSRARFATAYPTSLTPTQFVDTMFDNAGLSHSGTDYTAAINEFGGAGNTADVAARGRAARRVAENSTLGIQEKNKAFVLMQYYGYLRRNPYDAPEATLDYAGYNFWLGKLNNHGGDFHAAQMVRSFIVSGEYLNRF
jgi:hypothetical protein